MSLRYYIAFCFILIYSAGTLWCGTTGKIVGRVIEAGSGQPLPGVNIVVENSVFGASTDVDGTYLILNLPPGTYALRAIMLGYSETLVTDIRVSVDKTTTVHFDLQPETVELGETIEIIAQRPLVKKDLTSTESIIGRAEIENLPVENFSDVVNIQAGVVEGHFRGGRLGEVSYLINGVPVNDPYSGTFALEIENNAIEELSVISGTFNAEYGQAMSGVVNIVTKDGGSEYTGSASVYAGDYVSNHSDIFRNINKVNPILNAEGTLSGPLLGIGNLHFFASGRYFQSDGFIYGQNVFLPTDQSDFTREAPEDWVVMSRGRIFEFEESLAGQLIESAEAVSMNDSRRVTGNLKIGYQAGSSDRINLEGIFQRQDWRDYEHRFRLNPTGDYQREQTSSIVSTQWSHVFNPRTFLETRASYFHTEFHQYVYEDLFDERYVPAERLQSTTGSAFLSGGQQMWHFNRRTTTHLLKNDLISQVTNQHQFKLGTEIKRHRLWMHEFEVRPDLPERIAPPSSFNNNLYQIYPLEASIYIQDKMEYADIVINAGARYDYFKSDGEIPLDFSEPTDSDRRQAETSSQLSPRLGIAHSISSNGKIHVSYGHFFQTPNFFYLYVNPEFEIFPLQGTPSPPPQSLLNTVGNAELMPQKTVIYEIGLQQQVGDIFSIALTAFNKDIRNLLGIEVLQTIQGQKYGRYINRDYANVRGMTFEFLKQHASGISTNIDYTFQVAKGNASDPNTAFLDAQTDPPTETEKQFVPLDWDRRHQINVTLTLGNPGQQAFSAIGRYGTGLPYTPSYQNIPTSVENSGTRPDQFTVDLYGYKNIEWLGLHHQFFVRIFNVFDRLNEENVFSDTGRSGYSLAPTYEGPPRGLNTLEEFYIRPDFYAQPRRIQAGLQIQF